MEYWALRAGEIGLQDLEGIEEFRKDLANSYVGQVHARPGGAGFLYGLSVEFLTSFTLQHFVNLILEGVAYDLVKSGGNALVLKPFISAYNSLKKKNADRGRDIQIDSLLLSFQDTVVLIDDLGSDAILGKLDHVLVSLAANYSRLILRTGERPFRIIIPVFEDPTDDRPSRFRQLLDVDETIRNITADHYLSLWGAEYDYARVTRVYEVKTQLLLDEEFYTRSRYWQAMEGHRKKDRAG